MKKYLEVGQIVGTHGIKGFIKVKPLTDDIKRFSKLKKVYMIIRKSSIEDNNEDFLATEGKGKESYVVKNEQIEFSIEEVKYNKNIVLIKLKDINTIEEAESYRGNYLQIDRKDSVKLPEDSYFIVDLIGINVYNEEDELLGKIDDIYNTGSNDIYVVKHITTGKQILLPAIKDVIKKVDIQNNKVIVKILEGLV